ncbi:ATP-dependent helicase HrpB [Terrarubrum flagellatum]|uniref:ATP-dependent helicase HrpB n=1 Tax=Terrirubrum flagellatum TaxID=2895980 RepID=UPI0031452402
MRPFSSPLPIDEALPELLAALSARNSTVLVAPPGAGKTTRVPLALLDESWLGDKKIILLEPRRLAARAAADRMAKTLGEKVGDTVGLRVRLGSKISARTRIEVVTEGVFTRMIVDDPELAGVGAVLFDEYHERSLDADLGLAFALDAQAGLRPDLRVLVMSATLDGARVSSLLDDAPLIRSEGRSFPVETRHVSRDPNRRIEDQIVDVIQRSLRADTGSLLVFLPGQGPIARVADRTRESVDAKHVLVAPLYGAMDQRAQDEAVQPAPSDVRKIVLATSIAETSLTIEGVRVVIDSGLARVPRYEPDIGVTRLETVRVSRAAADQRRGRAGRIEPGVCYRLWDEAATGALDAFARPEILDADLSGLLLDCASWGMTDPTQLKFLDAPPAPALNEARALLTRLDALDETGRLTEMGRRIRALPLPARLARMVIDAATHGQAREAALIAAVIVERGLGGDGVDLHERLDRFGRDRGDRARAMRQSAENWAREAAQGRAKDSSELSEAALLALAYPDRIAKARGKRGDFVMANGRGASLPETDRLARASFLVIAEISGGAANARILLAATLETEEIDAIAAQRGVLREEIAFDPAARALRARGVRRLDAIVLDEKPLPVPATIESARALARGAAATGIDRLNWSKAQAQLRERVNYLRAALLRAGDTVKAEAWPDLSDGALASSAEEWLAPYIIGRTRLDDISPDDLQAALDALVPYNLRRDLDAAMPSHFAAPTGSQIAIDYGLEEGPVLAIRVQELFGLDKHPAIGGGAIPLTLHLLSPARRPIQITKDLPGFWRGSWAAVRSDLRGQYPRHPWPENPREAAPTTRAKPRGT